MLKIIDQSLDMDCPIWGSASQVRQHSPLAYRVNSLRAGGGYIIGIETANLLRPGARILDLTEPTGHPGVGNIVRPSEGMGRARLTTLLVDQRRLGNSTPTVNQELLEAARTKQPLSFYERAERLLQYLGQSIPVGTATEDYLLNKRGMAESESLNNDELQLLLDYLGKKEWIDIDNGRIKVTFEGHSRIEEGATRTDSAQAFVAMWIDDNVEDAYSAIRKAVESAGYRPYRVDKNVNDAADSGTLDAIIMAEIRKSRFVIADFTHGDGGIRGSVYFEAGFALGLGIPVIFSCRKDLIDKLQFDVRQYPYIAWGTLDGLRYGLEQRILARIGEGSQIAR